MASFNRVILAGNLCRDIELKYTQSGLAVTELSLAVNDKRKDASGNWVEDVTFVDVTLFARSAEVASEYCQKGSNVLIEGRLKLDTWNDKHTGDKRSKLRVIGERLVMLGTKPKDGQSQAQAAPQASAPARGGYSAYDEGPPPQASSGAGADDGGDLPF